MTKDQAMKILGISRFTYTKKLEQAYRQKCQQLQIRMIPGNPCLERRKAQTELAELATAWKTLSNRKSTENKNLKPRTATKQYPINRTTTHVSPQNLGGFWDDFFDILPIPKPVVMILLIAMFFLVFVSLFKTL
jgi:hypothetical protein